MQKVMEYFTAIFGEPYEPALLLFVDELSFD